jgi:hypothetical protein
MAVKSGRFVNQRGNARNYTHPQAQKRLDETVDAFNKQVENSLRVDSVEIELYQIQQLVGVPCSCSQTHTQPLPEAEDGVTEIAPVIPHKESRNDGIRIKFQDDDFLGDGLGEKLYNDEDTLIHDVSGRDESVHEIEDGEDEFHDTVMRGSVNCGICYRTMLQPGFTVYGRQRAVCTNLNIENLRAFTVDSTQAPHRMVRTAEQGFVSFLIIVPKYFKSVTVSIRNNLVVLPERVQRFDGTDITLEDLRDHAGQEYEVYVRVEEFTHLVLDFDLGVERPFANLSGENIALDYDRLTTLSDMSVVLGPELGDVNGGDIIVIPSRNMILKVRDKERKITAKQRRLEWVVQTRVLQPTEPLKAIAKGYKLL